MKNNSIITSKYEGWITSLILHGLLSIIFIFIIYDKQIDISEYSNLTFSNYSPVDMPVIEDNKLSQAPLTPVIASAPRASRSSSESVISNRKIDIPTRRMTEHDINRIPVESQGQISNVGQNERIDTKREAIHGIDDNISSLDDEIFNSARPGTKPSDKSVGEKIDAVATPGQKGGDITFDKPYEISWEGIVRDILYDPLPKYPPGLDKEARIQIRITVLPNGTIGNLIPLQKADATLESETMRTLKLWRLSPLKPTDPQLNQTATITFRFILQ